MKKVMLALVVAGLCLAGDARNYIQTYKEKYSCIKTQHGVAAQVALKNHLRATDAFKAEAEKKRLREKETREREARRQLRERTSQPKKQKRRNNRYRRAQLK